MKSDLLKTKIGIVGMGIVGHGIFEAWTAKGYNVVGFDVNDQAIEWHRSEGRDVRHMSALPKVDPELLFVCVSTPMGERGEPNLNHVCAAMRTIGEWLKTTEQQYPMIVVRSTLFPTTSEKVLIPILEEVSGKKAGVGFGYGYLPELLRETSNVEDALHMWRLICGGDALTVNFMKELYREEYGDEVDLIFTATNVTTAEAAKISVNVRNAAIISMNNELAALFTSLGVNAQEAITLAAMMQEGTLNPLYGTAIGADGLGIPFGGSCLPKDLANLLFHARQAEIEMPVFYGTAATNNGLQQRAGKKPEVGGFRRASAQMLRQRSVATQQHLTALLAGETYSPNHNNGKASHTRSWQVKEVIEL